MALVGTVPRSLKSLSVITLIGFCSSTFSEAFDCYFFENGTKRFETLVRDEEGFLVKGRQSPHQFTVEIVEETSTALFLLENFQHPPINDDRDTGSFLLRVVDKKSLGYIWSSLRFSDTETDFHYRGACMMLID